MRKIVAPCVTTCCQSSRIIRHKEGLFIILVVLVPKRDETSENIIALIEPVALCVGAELRPAHGRIEDAALFGNDGKFFFPAQIIADVMILDKGLARMAGLSDQHGDGNGRLPEPNIFPPARREVSPLVR